MLYLSILLTFRHYLQEYTVNYCSIHSGFFFQGNVMGPYFAFCAVVDGIQYKTGLGQNKKESRSNAAKLALDELLQLDEPEPRVLEPAGKCN